MARAYQRLNRQIKYANERGASIAPLSPSSDYNEQRRAKRALAREKTNRRASKLREQIRSDIAVYNQKSVEGSRSLNLDYLIEKAKTPKELQALKRKVRYIGSQPNKELQEKAALRALREYLPKGSFDVSSPLYLLSKKSASASVSAISSAADNKLRRKDNIMSVSDARFLANYMRAAIRTGNMELARNLREGGLQYAFDLDLIGYAINDVYIYHDEDSAQDVILKRDQLEKLDWMRDREIIEDLDFSDENYSFAATLQTKIPSIKEAKDRAASQRRRRGLRNDNSLLP